MQRIIAQRKLYVIALPGMALSILRVETIPITILMEAAVHRQIPCI